jgi:hypothetical protein
MTQFYKLTLDRAIADYRDGLITATGLLRYYLKIRYAPGWKIRLNPEEICSLLGFTRATFYKALAKLKNLGRAEIGKLNLVPVTLTEESEADEEQDSLTVDTQYPSVDTQSPTEEKESPTRKSRRPSENLSPPKPLKNNASSDSPDSNSNSYQTFSASLSQNQRESFFKFCEQQASQLPKPPVLIKKWIQNNWEELVANWQKKFRDVVSLEANNAQKDWRNHPKFSEWLNYVRINYGGFCATDTLDCRDIYGNGEVYVFGTREDRAERRAFAAWARANKLI